MIATKRTAGVLGAAFGAGASLVMLAGTANAAPYADTPSISVSTGNPAKGGSLNVLGEGFGSKENVAIDLHSTVVRLLVTTTDGTGQFSATVTLPSSFECRHFISATGATTGRAANANIVIGSCDDDNDHDSDDHDRGSSHNGHKDNGGSLPRTGAAVAGTALLGAALVGGGVTLRRRQKIDA